MAALLLRTAPAPLTASLRVFARAMSHNTNQHICIIGGVAGGASCAARLRRLDETATITVFERGPYVSFANCGLPYRVGDVITSDAELLLATPERFKVRFNIHVQTNSNVQAIDRAAREITVTDTATNTTSTVKYDKLVLATGAKPIRPDIPGINLPGVFSLKTIPDAKRITEWIQGIKKADDKPARAIVIGGGFIGLEMCENLHARKMQVTVIEKAPQVMGMLDTDLARPVAQRIRDAGVDLLLGHGATAIHQNEDGSLKLTTDLGKEVDADIIVLGIGVRPETELAVKAGLEIGARGGIKVDEHLRTSDEHIYAVGDVIEVKHVVTNESMLLPLAGPANRQGRIAADNICGRPTAFRGVEGTAICGLFGLQLASTGANTAMLRRAGLPFETVRLHPGHHVSYFPGAHPIHMKVFFDPTTGKILGGQAVGEAGVDRRIDVLAAAIQSGSTVMDIAESELCYAPQFGAAKDPINMAGMIASNVVNGDIKLADWDTVLANPEDNKYLVLDVRTAGEYKKDHLPGALHIPLEELRERFREVPTDKPVATMCEVGQRAYYAARMLTLNGYDASILSGGMKTYRCMDGRCQW